MSNLISNDNAVQAAQIVRPLTEINERECVAALAREVRPGGLIVEVGCLYGGMTAVIALANPKAKVIAVDNFSWHPADDGPASTALLFENMAKVGANNVTVVEGDSLEVGKTWKKPAGLVYIDGGHSYEAAYADLCNFSKHTKTIVMHDYGNPHLDTVRNAVGDFLKGNPAWTIAQVVGTMVTLRKA